MTAAEARIVAVAVRLANSAGDIIISREAPARHHHLLYMISRLGVDGSIEQGFLLNDGRFVDRLEALTIARNAKQIIKRCGGDDIQLYSENLW